VYVKVVNGQVVCVGLPTCGVLVDGRCVSGYNLLPPETLAAEGWFPLELNQPEYDPETQELQLADYTVQPDKVIANYEAVAIIYIPTAEDRIEAIETVVTGLMDMIMMPL
jgi:hypothetical protein